VDGVLRTVDEIKDETCKAVINSIKAVSGMDISEKRRPQDGAFIAKKGNTNASFRVASAGVLNGEKLSIRVLNGSEHFYWPILDLMKHYLMMKCHKKPSGMV
jgi:type II secretory ATPase GspE/PulE/Tfp pilus assembly ATPase PilB-like protein